MVTVTKHKVNLTPSQHETLRKLAFDKRTTISFQIRIAVDRYLKSLKRTPNGR